MPKEKLIEVARSYARHKNLGNYEGCDFFCSAKQEVAEEEIKTTSAKLFAFCKKEVENDIVDYGKLDVQKTKQMWDDKKQELYDSKSKLEDIKAELQESEELPIIDQINL